MMSDDFEWDDAKAAKNFRDHKITFEMARDVFADPFIVEWIDEGHGDTEQRFAALGMVDGRVLLVCYSPRGDRVRSISARRAEPWERRRYHNENQT
jgi:hypothetical protein